MKEYFSAYSDEEAYRIARLIAGFVRGTLSQAEHLELDDWVNTNDENMRLFERLTDDKNLEQAANWMAGIETEQALKKKKKGLAFTRPAANDLWSKFLPYTAAAVVIIAAGLMVLKFSVLKKSDPLVSSATAGTDILPGSNKAMLILADGKKIVLDRAGNGPLIKQGNTSINKSDGQLAYTNAVANENSLFNTISIPNGGQYRLTLSDGTRVWLNATSSLYYPVAFTGNERSVSVTGEAYFEVTKNAAKPFKVKINDITIEVLGTHFNVNAYNNEPVVRTTLAEGSIQVFTGMAKATLLPGQEAQINPEKQIKTAAADLDETLAWKNGQFLFKDAPIEKIMRQVARWYDAEVVYEDRPADHFNAEFPRDIPVSKLLGFLELTNRVHFKVEDKKIIVLK